MKGPHGSEIAASMALILLRLAEVQECTCRRGVVGWHPS
jgi:hypothetical protein